MSTRNNSTPTVAGPSAATVEVAERRLCSSRRRHVPHRGCHEAGAGVRDEHSLARKTIGMESYVGYGHHRSTHGQSRRAGVRLTERHATASERVGSSWHR
jgi:hypothetical protein